ncbi:MAG: ABC transporter substrate-binding protein [Nanoarchaeota archaeon]
MEQGEAKMENTTKLMMTGLVLALIVVSGCATQTTQIAAPIEEKAPIKIGAVIALTGSNSVYGEQAKRGIEIAVEEINKEGIKGRPLQIIYEDSKGNAKEAMTIFSKLRGDNITVFLTLTSAVAMALSPLANQEKSIQMEMGAVAPKYATPADYTFRTVMNAYEFSKGIAKALKSKGINRVGLFHVNSEWGAGMAQAAADTFEKEGITIVQTEIFDEGASDMSTQLLKLKTGSFHDIVLVSTQPEAGRVLKQAGELNLGKQWYSDSYTVEGQMVLDTAGAAADGVIYVTPAFDKDDKNEAVQGFVVAYAKKHSQEPAFLEAQAYDGVNLIADSMRRCSDPLDTECLKNTLAKTSGYNGASGAITFDENGDPVGKTMALKTIRDGKYVGADSR